MNRSLVLVLLAGAMGVAACAAQATSQAPTVVTPSAAASASVAATAAPSASGPTADEPRDATRFGMIGVLGTTDGGASGAPSGDPIGNSFGAGGLGASGTGASSAPHPKASIRMGAATVNGRLPPEVIQRIVRQNFGRFSLCYDDGLKKNPKLGGRVAVKFVIGTSGAVEIVSDGGSDLPSKDVTSCVLRAFGNLSFPQPESGKVTVVYPMTFQAADAPKPTSN